MTKIHRKLSLIKSSYYSCGYRDVFVALQMPKFTNSALRGRGAGASRGGVGGGGGLLEELLKVELQS